MLQFLDQIFSARPEMWVLPIVADGLMALSCVLLAFLFFRYTYSRKDLQPKKTMLFFGLFFLLAATVHVVNIWAPIYPIYSLQVFLKIVLGVAALLSLILLSRIFLAAKKLPSPEKIKELEMELQSEREVLADLENKKVFAESEKKRLEGVLINVNQQAQREKDSKEKVQKILRRTESIVRILPEAMKEIEDAGDFYAALEMGMQKIRETIGSEYGELWIPRSDGKVLECISASYEEGQLRDFYEFSREFTFPLKMGLPGKVWESRSAFWIEDMAEPPAVELLPIEKIRSNGFQSAVAFPIILEDSVSAALIFYRKQILGEDIKWLKDWFSVMGAYLSTAVQKHRLGGKLRDVEQLVEKKVNERTQQLEKSNLALERDIQESRSAAESIRRSQENFQTLVNSIDGIVWEYDLHRGTFSFISEQTEKILGYPVESWFSDAGFWQDHIHGADREMAIEFRQKVAQSKKDASLDYRMITSEGSAIWMRDMVNVVVVDDHAIKLRGVMVDITERKQAEETLNQERNFVSAVLETAGAMVVILDTEGRVVRFNRACEQISGYMAHEVQGQPIWKFVAANETEKIKKIFMRLMAGQFPTNYESSWLAKDGTERSIAWSSTALLNRYGNIIHIVATGIDITKRNEIEQKLKHAVSDLGKSNAELDRFAKEVREANHRLTKLDELKSHFISAASHELRTPLTSIKGYVEMVLNEEAGSINDEQKEYLKYVKESTDRLHRLLRELLDISKIESGQVKMRRDRTDLRTLIKDEISLFKPQASEKEITLVMDVDPALKSIFCDADKIREVFDNLLSNAIKYTPSRGKITVLARNHLHGVEISVKDTGVGIKNGDKQRIFEPFQRIESNVSAEREEGTGLGLTLVKRIIEAHGGEISVESEEGRGSLFLLILPLEMKDENLKELIGRN